MSACMCTACVFGTHRSQKRAPDSLEQELQIAVSYHMGAGPLEEQLVLSTAQPSLQTAVQKVCACFAESVPRCRSTDFVAVVKGILQLTLDCSLPVCRMPLISRIDLVLCDLTKAGY